MGALKKILRRRNKKMKNVREPPTPQHFHFSKKQKQKNKQKTETNEGACGKQHVRIFFSFFFSCVSFLLLLIGGKTEKTFSQTTLNSNDTQKNLK